MRIWSSVCAVSIFLCFYILLRMKMRKHRFCYLISIDGPDFGTFNYKKKTKIDHSVDSVKIFSE